MSKTQTLLVSHRNFLFVIFYGFPRTRYCFLFQDNLEKEEYLKLVCSNKEFFLKNQMKPCHDSLKKDHDKFILFNGSHLQRNVRNQCKILGFCASGPDISLISSFIW